MLGGDETRFQRSLVLFCGFPGALPQAGMNDAVGVRVDGALRRGRQTRTVAANGWFGYSRSTAMAGLHVRDISTISVKV